MKKRLNGTTSSLNKAGFKRVMIALVVLLLSATLMVGAVSADPVPVNNWVDLKQNLTAGQSVVLTGNIGENDPVLLDSNSNTGNTTWLKNAGDVTLDLGEYTIYAKGTWGNKAPALFKIGNESQLGATNLTVTATTGGISIDNMTDAYAYVFAVLNSSKLVINSGSFTVKNGIVIGTDGTKTGTVPKYQDPEIIIKGGTLTSNNAVIYLPAQGSKLTINAGSLIGGTGIDLRTGTVTINDGTIITNGPKPVADEREVGYSTNSGAAVALTKQSAYPGQPIVIINDGTLESTNNVAVFNYVNSTDTSGETDVAPLVKIADAAILSGKEGKLAGLIADGQELVGTFEDMDGNILIAQNVPNTGVTWDGDKLTLGALSTNEYKQYDAITTSGIKFNGAATYNGTNKDLVLTATDATAIDAQKDGVTLKNLSVIADEDATFGTAIKFGKDGKLYDSNVVLVAMTADVKDGRRSSIAVDLGSGTSEVKRNLIFAGNSEMSSSQAIVVRAGTATIENNLLFTASAYTGTINGIDKHSSGSIAVRVCGTGATANVNDNFIYSDDFTLAAFEEHFPGELSAEDVAELQNLNLEFTTPRHVAFAIDGTDVDSSSVINASKNMIVLATTSNDKYGTVVYLNDDGTTTKDAKVELTNNIVYGSSYVIYADDATESEGKAEFTISGKIINNNFKDIKAGVVSYKSITPKFANDFKWNETTPIALKGNNDYVDVTEGQLNVAGNYWAWSANQAGTPSGYMVLTEEVAKAAYGVTDLMPLVKINTTPAITINGGDETNLSIINSANTGKILTAELEGVPGAKFTWTVADGSDTLITLNPTTAAESITYTPKSGVNGTTQIIVAYAENPMVNTTITITVFAEAKPNLNVGIVAEEPTQPATGYAVTLTFTSDDTVKSVIPGEQLANGNYKDAVLVFDDGTKIHVSFDENGGVANDKGIDGVITEMIAEYAPSAAPASQELEGVEYGLSIGLDAKQAIDATGKILLPTINPGMDKDVTSQIKGDYTPLAMFTASMGTSDELVQFNKKITEDGVELTFIIKGDHSAKKFKVIHIGKSGTQQIIDANDNYANGKTTVTAVSNDKFSSYVLVQDNTKPAAQPSQSESVSGTSEWLTDSSSQPTQQPTDKPTDKPTDTVPTDVPTTSKPTEEPSSPGFGILAALAGLGAVAVLRRK